MRNLLLISAMWIGLSASALPQQWWSSSNLRVHVPFEFFVHSQNLPPGDYMLQIFTVAPGVISILDAKGNRCDNAFTSPLGRQWSGEPQLIFRVVGKSHFLAEIDDRRVGVLKLLSRPGSSTVRKAQSPDEAVIAAK